MDDLIVNAAQDLLKEQFEISGFQNTTLGCNLSFDILRSEFVQILHKGKNHWLTTSTVGWPAATVNVFDSLNQSLSQCTVNQVCALIFTRNQTIDVRFIDVEPQTNSSDCGVYALLVAFSYSCRMPPAGRMIQCSHCKEQFHKKCERVTRNELSCSWQCRLCAKK